MSFYEEITGEKTQKITFEEEQCKVKEMIRSAKKSNCHGVDTFYLSPEIRLWLENEGFFVDRVNEIFYKCSNNDEFNYCDCFPCRNAGKETGAKIWSVTWPKKAKK